MRCYLAIDQGTHASRALVFDEAGNRIAESSAKVQLHRLDAERVEQSADELKDSVHRVVRDVLAKCHGNEIAACGLATQRSTVLAWNTDGHAISPALSWQDVRARTMLGALEQYTADIQKASGLPLSPHYGASKLHWLMQQPDSAAADRYSPLVSYLLFHLLNDQPYLVDHCNAQRTQLFSLEQLDWSQQLCDWFAVNKKYLPTCMPVCHDYGTLDHAATPLTAVSGDQNAALYADGALPEDVARINLGSGAFVMRTLERYCASETQLSGIALSATNKVVWMREATINGAGSALDWVQDTFNITRASNAIADSLSEVKSPPIFINSVGGLGSPWWCSDVEPHFVGNELSASQRIAGVIESIAFMINANLDIMREEAPVERLRVSGGLSNLDALCQCLANVSGLMVERGTEEEATARGIAWLAAGQPEHWQARTVFDVFRPVYDVGLQTRYESAMKVLQKLIQTQE